MGDGILQKLSSLAPPRRWWYLEVHFENKARLKPDKATSTAQLRFPLYRLAGCFDGLLAPHHFQPYLLLKTNDPWQLRPLLSCLDSDLMAKS
jgi:hypothetical protein